MIKTILITGGTGLIGKPLVKLLVQKGYKIHLLTRGEIKKNEAGEIRAYKWDVYKREIDTDCIEGVDAIIHLAGEEIGSKRWTDDRKRQIAESRTESIRMIYDLMRKNKNQINHVISASAVGYYGDRGNEFLTESSLPSKDFLAETCIAWEEAVDEGEKLGVRIVKLRSGIVLDKAGGVLPHLDKSLKFGIGAIPGSGSQWVSWIHMRDALLIYTYALENEDMKGAYNMVAPEPVTLEQLCRSVAGSMKKSPLYLHIPAFALKIAIGEMSLMVLESTKASSEKLSRMGYNFEYPDIDKATFEIYNSPKSTNPE
ncbi:MAG: TIGR01777 family oxidoreductase [Daejeonella sp.]